MDIESASSGSHREKNGLLPRGGPAQQIDRLRVWGPNIVFMGEESMRGGGSW